VETLERGKKGTDTNLSGVDCEEGIGTEWQSLGGVGMGSLRRQSATARLERQNEDQVKIKTWLLTQRVKQRETKGNDKREPKPIKRIKGKVEGFVDQLKLNRGGYRHHDKSSVQISHGNEP